VSLLRSTIIAPDSSHWANWIDAALSSDSESRSEARRFHRKLIEAGRVPLLSWHHLEELLSIEDETWARDRIAFIQSLPLVAFLRMPFDRLGVGAITDILAAEAIAAAEGATDSVSVRNRAKSLLLQIGSGSEAIGDEAWVWQIMRPDFRHRNSQSKAVVAIGSFRFFDDSRTIGEISKDRIRPKGEFLAKVEEIRLSLIADIQAHGDRGIANPEAVAAEFVSEVMAYMPPEGMSARELLLIGLTAQGVDEDEILDHCKLSDLNTLAVFRAKLRVVAPKTGKPFEMLKAVKMEKLPSWLIDQALKTHGQKGRRQKGSDLNDGYLASLAAYADWLYVDKRTAEDFRRVQSKAPELSAILGRIAKTPHFQDLAEPRTR
jgi:hypothetical protein